MQDTHPVPAGWVQPTTEGRSDREREEDYRSAPVRLVRRVKGGHLMTCDGIDCSPDALHRVIDLTLLVESLTEERDQAREALAQARADAGMRRLGARSRQEHGAS